MRTPHPATLIVAQSLVLPALPLTPEMLLGAFMEQITEPAPVRPAPVTFDDYWSTGEGGPMISDDERYKLELETDPAGGRRYGAYVYGPAGWERLGAHKHVTRAHAILEAHARRTIEHYRGA